MVKANPKTKEKLLDAAQGLILAKGFKATSVEDICQAARLTKGSFFYYFKSKEDLAEVVLERFCCSGREKMNSCCRAKGKDPLKRILSYIDFLSGMAKDPKMSNGCLIGIFAQEISDTNPKLRSLCEKGIDEWAKVLEKDLEEAKRQYVPRANFDVKSLALYFISIFEGSQILAKARRNRKVMEQNMQHLKQYVKTLYQA